LEELFHNIGLSLTLNKKIPYILSLVGVFLSAFIISKSKRNIRILRFVIWIIPFGTYFAFNPIYEGDFSNNYSILDKKELPTSIASGELVIIAISGCPFCFESIATINHKYSQKLSLCIPIVFAG
jgi:hypothetical protein